MQAGEGFWTAVQRGGGPTTQDRPAPFKDRRECSPLPNSPRSSRTSGDGIPNHDPPPNMPTSQRAKVLRPVATDASIGEGVNAALALLAVVIFEQCHALEALTRHQPRRSRLQHLTLLHKKANHSYMRRTRQRPSLCVRKLLQRRGRTNATGVDFRLYAHLLFEDRFGNRPVEPVSSGSLPQRNASVSSEATCVRNRCREMEAGD